MAGSVYTNCTTGKSNTAFSLWSFRGELHPPIVIMYPPIGPSAKMHLAYPYLIKNHHLTVQSPFVFWLLFNNHLKYLTGHGFTGLLDVWITLCTPLKSRTLVSVVYCSFQTIFWYIAKCSHKISECMHCPPSVMRFHFVLSRAVRAMVTLYIYVQIFSVNIQNHFVYYDYSDNGVHICIAIRLSCHTSEHV